MTDLTSFYKTDAVDDVLAADINVLISSSSYSTFRNVETLSADKDLTDADCPVQVLTPSGANKNVILPDEAITNHQFIIMCPTGSSYSIVVKTFGSVSTLATLAAGQMALVSSTGGEYGAVTGGISDGDKGDITVSSSGATWTIDNDAVSEAKIVNKAVTLAKMNDIATNRLIGRATAATGVPEALTVGAGLAFTTTTLSSNFGKPRLTSATSSASPAPNTDTTDIFILSAISDATVTFGAPSGTPNEGQRLLIRLKDNGTARVLDFTNAAYRAVGTVKPTTTVISKLLYIGLIYNADGKWDMVSVAQES